MLSGVNFGTVTTNSGGTLVLTFDGDATQTLVNEALRSIAYANSSDSPPHFVQIDWVFSDGNAVSQGAGGALRATGSTTVSITSRNDPPSAIVLDDAVTSLAEGTTSAARIKIADIRVIDDNLGTNSLALSGADADVFEIDGAVLYLKPGTTLNYEDK